MMFLLLGGDYILFLLKQKTAYEVRISDWSSDVCTADLIAGVDAILGQRLGAGGIFGQQLVPDVVEVADQRHVETLAVEQIPDAGHRLGGQIGRASCRARVCQYV